MNKKQIEYLLGNKKTFTNFVSKISKKDKIAILSHNDLDGITSAVFVQKILEFLNFKITWVHFSDYRKSMLEEIEQKVIKNKITKLFILDINVDNIDLQKFIQLSTNISVLLIDHHPLSKEAVKLNNIIKTKTTICTSEIIYDFSKELVNLNSWKWLLKAAIISDKAYSKNIKDTEKLHNSKYGKISRNISSALIYYQKDTNKVYNLILENKIKKFEKIDKIIKKEINKYLLEFQKKGQYYVEKKLFIYIFNPKYDVGSVVATLLSVKNPENSYIAITNVGDENYLKISGRNQSKKQNMNLLMQKGILNLKNASAGGHVPAAGARIMKKDLSKFLENILK